MKENKCAFSLRRFRLKQSVFFHVVMPPPFIMGGGGGHIASPLSVRPYVPYVRKMVSGRYLLNTAMYMIHISYTGI